uniref:Ectonucleotide pyrophosphatase/phosphodiesterase family member 3 n=1 Tax=Globodera rostochiensis TaxID=31243 RepID=A0A914I5I5_GLORO
MKKSGESSSSSTLDSPSPSSSSSTTALAPLEESTAQVAVDETESAMSISEFHTVSLRSPAVLPVVLSLVQNDGQQQTTTPMLDNGLEMPAGDVLLGCETKNDELPVAKTPEGNSNAQLIALPQVSVPTSKWPPTPLTARLLSSHRFLLALVFLLSAVAIILIVSLAVVIALNNAQLQQTPEEDAAFLNKDISWRSNCERKCNAKFDVPPLLLISMDGFRADFLQRGKTEAVSRISQCGATTEYMMPSYPSKTFPNHFTIATGLYPESHGIVDNYFYDEQMPDEKMFARSSRNPAWYIGEPIWNTVAKNGKKSAIFFWPGSEVPIQGIRPTYRYSYNATIPFSKRVDQVINWLRLDENERPTFLAIYFEQPDTAMHQEGPDSDAVNSALIYVDAMINYLMQQLDNNGFLGCINLIIVSDHGAQKLRDDMAVALDRFVDAADPGILEVFPGIIGQIKLRENNSTLLNKVLAPFECSGGQIFRVYTRDSMPRRYHYTRSGRIGEVVIDSAVGTKLFRTVKQMNGSTMKGEHGYDNRVSSMRAVFGAWEHRAVQPVHSTDAVACDRASNELFSLFAPNNGTPGRLHSLLRSPPSVDLEPLVELAECAGARLVKCGDGCHFELHYSGQSSGSVSMPSSPSSAGPDEPSASDGAGESSGPRPDQSASTTKVPIYSSQHCKYVEHLLIPAQLYQRMPMCTLRMCNATLVFNLRWRVPNFVESQLTAPVPNIDHRGADDENGDGSGERPMPTATTPPASTTMTTSTTNGEETNEIMESFEDQMVERPMGNQQQTEDNSLPSMADQETERPTQSTPTSHEQCVRLGTLANNASGNAWISLFSDNDYARYIHQGKIRVPIGFYNGVWQQILSLIRQYVQHYKRLLMWSGPVWDHDNDGLVDWDSATADAAATSPSHVFLILLRCPGADQWDARGRWCSRPENTSTLSFVLPLLERDLNCLFPVEYIFRHTSRIRDIELLTGNEWFTDRTVYPHELALQLRTYINDQLWQLELT